MQEYGVGIFTLAKTKSALKKALKKKCITVNGEVATSATFIRGGEQLCLTFPKRIRQSKQLVFPLKVLFEDEYLAIIHKPAGILVSGNKFKTVANALAQNLKQSSLDDATIAQPVHRLDYATTGLLLIGKTSASIRVLNSLFAEHKIEKTYYAVTIGQMSPQGILQSELDGKYAAANYRVISTLASVRFGQLNLVKLSPQTGRRHQLRKQLAALSNPILGDQYYGTEPLILKGKGMYLHAHTLAFVHPFTGKECKVVSPCPPRFTKLFPGLVE